MTVLYVTTNGLTDHIGRAQVVPYLVGLARAGFTIHVLSAEKPNREDLIKKYQALLDEVGITWTRVRYRNKPILFGQLMTQWVLAQAMKRILRQEPVRFIHCRSVPPALIAYRLKKKFGINYVFDFRHFYADGGLENRRGLVRWVYRWLKAREGHLMLQAEKVVCLTERAQKTLLDWYFSTRPDASNKFHIIPCCADFSHFEVSHSTKTDALVLREKLGINPNAVVLLYLGSLGADYMLHEMMRFYQQLLRIKPDAHFLLVSNNGLEWVNEVCQEQAINQKSVHFVSVDREEVPSYIAIADFSVVFITPGVSKIGCSPTKIAELFACNVPVVANAGIGDLDQLLALSRNGSLVIPDFSDESFRNAILQIICYNNENHVPIRENSRDLSLEVGIEKYSAMYRELLDC